MGSQQSISNEWLLWRIREHYESIYFISLSLITFSYYRIFVSGEHLEHVQKPEINGKVFHNAIPQKLSTARHISSYPVSYCFFLPVSISDSDTYKHVFWRKGIFFLYSFFHLIASCTTIQLIKYSNIFNGYRTIIIECYVCFYFIFLNY